MSFLYRNIDRIKGLFKRGVQVIPQDEYASPVQLRSTANVSVNNNTAMNFTAVFAAMRLRAENVASLPKVVLGKTAKGKEVAKSHPVHRLVHYKPNSYMNIFVFWEFINAYLDGHGNSYAIIERNGQGDPVALWPVHPSYVCVTLVNRKKFYKVYGTKGFDGTYSDDEMLHFMLFTRDGITGINPIVYNADAIGLGMAATKFGQEFFEKGGHIKGALEYEDSMGDAEFNRFMKHYENSSKNFGTPFLEYGIKYKEIGISPEAAQMLQSKTFAVQDVARIFNVPPHMLAELSRSTFSNIEHQDIQFVKYSIRPSVKRFETEIESKLFFENETDSFEMKFVLDGLLRGDLKSRSAFYHFGIQDGWLTRNEVREMENKNQANHLDTFLYPQNLQPADQSNNNNNNE